MRYTPVCITKLSRNISNQKVGPRQLMAPIHFILLFCHNKKIKTNLVFFMTKNFFIGLSPDLCSTLMFTRKLICQQRDPRKISLNSILQKNNIYSVAFKQLCDLLFVAILKIPVNCFSLFCISIEKQFRTWSKTIK